MTLVMVNIRVSAHTPCPQVTLWLVSRLEQTLGDTSRAGACPRVRSDSVVVAIACSHHGKWPDAYMERRVDRAVRPPLKYWLDNHHP